MARKFTGYIDESECIGDSLGTQGITGQPKGSINGNSLSLDEAVQALSAGSVTVASGNFSVGSNLIVGNNLSGTNMTLTNNLSVNNDVQVAGSIIVFEELYVRGARGTGGTTTDIIYNGFPYRVHTYTGLGANTFTVTRSGEIEFLLVGGGGSGGNHTTTNANGGGGGGGIIYKPNHYINAGTYSLFVGDGGPAVAFRTNSAGITGQNSTFLGYVAYGGGGGAGSGSKSSTRGGSSGGGAYLCEVAAQSLQVDVSGARGYGNKGGDIAVAYTGCGGGGAGGPGASGRDTSDWGGDGGFGMPFIISGTERYYGGGGGGGGNSSQKAGAGWHGGGRGFGTTAYHNHLTYPTTVNDITLGFNTPDAIDGTGGGGGAGSYWSDTSAPQWANKGSGKGGSGIIIVRYRL